MPQPSFHLHHAGAALDALPYSLPFDTSNEQNRSAFLHGALGPDMGFFPGAWRALADLAHRQPTGIFARALLAEAETEADVAYAYGWVSHILIDAFLHPAINRAAAERLGLCPESTPTSTLAHTHIRLEIGLDLIVHRREPAVQRIRLDPLLDERSAAAFCRALERVHDVQVPAAAAVASHRRVSQVLGPMLALQASMALARFDGVEGQDTHLVIGLRAGLNTLRALAVGVRGPDSHTAAFLTPVQPGADLVQSLDAAVARFHGVFQSHVEHGLTMLPDYDPENGSLASPVFGESAA